MDKTTKDKVERFARENNSLRPHILPIGRASGSASDAIISVVHALPLSEVFGELSLKTQASINTELYKKYGVDIFHVLCDENFDNEKDNNAKSDFDF